MQSTKEKIRLDKYLWAIRIFKTRTLAAEACDKGKIKCEGRAAKASKTVHPGEEYEIKSDARNWMIKVISLLEQRVQYAEAIKHYADLSPKEERNTAKFEVSSFHTGKRLSKIGRPTKKQRRDIDSFLKK